MDQIPTSLSKRIDQIESWRQEQHENLNQLLSQVESHYETLNQLFRNRRFQLVAIINEHFEKRYDSDRGVATHA